MGRKQPAFLCGKRRGLSGEAQSKQHMAARLTIVEDELEIRSLVALYCFAFDDGDTRLAASLFTPNGILRSVGVDVGAVGRAAIEAQFEARRQGVSLMNHVTHNHVIRSNGDKAQGLLTAHVELVRDGVVMVGSMRYRDKYVRLNGKWCFAERALSMLYYLPLKDYPAGLLAIHQECDARVERSGNAQNRWSRDIQFVLNDKW
jgi:hypothetical protein